MTAARSSIMASWLLAMARYVLQVFVPSKRKSVLFAWLVDLDM